MTPLIYPLLAQNTGVQAKLGNPVRFYPFGFDYDGDVRPYAVWQIVGGSPENYLGNAPDMDSYTIQLDVYGSDGATARAAAKALRDALELRCYITRWGGEWREPETDLIRVSLDVTWQQARA